MAYIGPEPNPGQNREVEDISSGFNGSEVNFTLQVNSQNVSPGSANAIIVSLGGVVQNPGTDYTVAASTLTFTTAPASGLSFFGLVLGQGVDAVEPADASVTASKLATNSVETAKIADQAVTLAKLPHGTGSNDGKFLRANNGADPTFETIPTPSGFVTGMIIMWNSTVASIPSGFVLCDGNNSTPDLRDKFIVGAKQDDSGTAKTNVTGSLTQTGGSATHTLTEAEMPSHVHHVQITTDSSGPFGSVFAAGNNSSQGFVATTSKGSGNAHNNLPPYYALCFIMKT
jgi:hypothetical protein